MDDALVIWLNGLALRRPWLATAVGVLARRLAGLEVCLMLLLALSGRGATAARMLAAVGSVYVASEGLGELWPRERPFARITLITPLTLHTAGRAFPSRHVASGLAMAAIVGRSHPGLGWCMAAIAWGLGLTRVAAGLHYPSDVLGGAALGLAIARLLRM